MTLLGTLTRQLISTNANDVLCGDVEEKPALLPPAFSHLTPAEIEDCLCIFRDDLRANQLRTGGLQRVSHCIGSIKTRVRKCCRLCENSDAKPSNPIFAQFWPVLSDQKPADRENSL